MRMRVALLSVVVLACRLSDAAWAGQPDSPYMQPTFERLMDAVTLRVSFDDASMVPEMAEGDEHQPNVFASSSKGATGPRFAEGLVGRALVLGTGGATYPRKGNVLLERRGAIAVWVRPEGWQRPNDHNTVFAMTSRATFYLQRQGPAVDKDGRVRRHEAVQYLAAGPDGQLTCITGGSDWANGRWYLLVANWSWPTFELSVNGQPFKGRSLSGMPKPETFGNLVLGARSGQKRGLLDEFLAFRRPLALDEVRLLHTTFKR